jgi:hypothetical protein
VSDFGAYLEFVEGLDDEQLELEICDRRKVLAGFDKSYSELRELGESPSDEMVETSTSARTKMQLAEREQGKRGQTPYGTCDNGVDNEEEI